MRSFDVVVIGAGLAGIYMLHQCRQRGLSAVSLEAGPGIGGTWYWNRYPGARCDIESVDYSYSFSEELDREWVWTEKYPAQPEILSYINHVVDRFGLRDDILLNHRVESMRFDEADGRWALMANGAPVSAKYVVLATGLLSLPIKPNIPGIESFSGEVYHTAMWPHEPVDFSGKKVGIIGTGSSGVQAIPVIAQAAEQLTVFQRTASYAVPARNSPLSKETLDKIKATYPTRRKATRESAFGTYWSAFETNTGSALAVSPAEREAEYSRRWEAGGYGFIAAYGDLLVDMEANKTAADYLRSKVRELVDDPEVAEKLCPREDLPFGCKRLLITNGYYETFNRDNVSLVHLPDDPIIGIEPQGVRTETGLHELDVIVLASGFDALTGSILKMDVRGIDGISLRDHWADGPRDYLGFMCAGFPNMFLVNGPHAPGGNYVTIGEQMVEWVARLLDYAERNQVKTIDTTRDAEDQWLSTIDDIARVVVAVSGCNSWFLGSNVPGKKRTLLVFFGSQGEFLRINGECEKSDYKGLKFETVADSPTTASAS